MPHTRTTTDTTATMEGGHDFDSSSKKKPRHYSSVDYLASARRQGTKANRCANHLGDVLEAISVWPPLVHVPAPFAVFWKCIRTPSHYPVPQRYEILNPESNGQEHLHEQVTTVLLGGGEGEGGENHGADCKDISPPSSHSGF